MVGRKTKAKSTKPDKIFRRYESDEVTLEEMHADLVATRDNNPQYDVSMEKDGSKGPTRIVGYLKETKKKGYGCTGTELDSHVAPMERISTIEQRRPAEEKPKGLEELDFVG